MQAMSAPAPGPRPRDAVLVVVGALAALLEVGLRPDLALPLPTLAVVLALLLLLPWRRRRPLAVVVAMTALGAALELSKALQDLDTTGMAASAVMLVVPAALFRHGAPRDRVVGAAVLGAGMLLSTGLGSGGPLGGIVGVAVLTVACLVGALQRERDRARLRERDLARTQEREALARDLHDTVAHRMTAIVLHAQVARAVPEDPERLARSLDAVEEEAQCALAEMRALVRDLREADTTAARLEDLAADGPPRVVVDLGGLGAAPLSETLRPVLFRLAQEGITNARRHARRPRRIEVRVSGRAGRVVLEVLDDGGPVDPAQAARGAAVGHGLAGMRERVAGAGGVLEAGPAEVGGWRLRAELPVGQEDVR